MNSWFAGAIVAPMLLAAAIVAPGASGQRAPAGADFLVGRAETGRPGGQLVVVQRAEPRTLNPVTAVDNPSRDVLRRMHADLIHINRETQRAEPELAASWTTSPDGRRYTVALRQGIRFSDGHPFDADDVVFSFRVYLDEKVEPSPYRDLLTVGGKPITVRKLDQYRVQFDLSEPYAAAERLFDSVAMLPRHLLEARHREGRLAEAWSLRSAAAEFAGLGPFRFKQHVPGERIVLERNPYYWKVDRARQRLPYLESLVFAIVPNADAQAVRFQSGEADVTTRMSAANFDVLARDQASRNYELSDLGASLDYTFLVFNLNDVKSKGLAETVRKQAWFRQLAFRRAVSLAIDREAIVRLVYRGRAAALWGHVPPGNKLWVNQSLPKPPRSIAAARELLQRFGFSWKDAVLVDGAGAPVEFTIVTNAENAERVQIATIIQDDLKQLGMRVSVVTLELRALTARLLTTHEYDACVLGLGGTDGDPATEMNVWRSGGNFHLWNLGQPAPATPWEAELDRLMQRQLTALDPRERKRLYDRVQELVVENLPITPLVSPNVLIGVKKGLGNLRPTVLDHHALWNVEELFWRERRSGATP
jgi:peptide/nickel transport system substrate-binding protein